MRIGIHRASRVPAASVVVHGVLGRRGAVRGVPEGSRAPQRCTLELGRLPRGRYAISDAKLVLGDLLGLESVTLPVDGTGETLVVYPRLVELRTLFCDAGRFGGNGRRLLLRRPAGFDFHSVREYTQGESLRRVHWPTTARRGQLMVKELEDTPHDAVAVVLDCDPAAVAGEPPDSSFDAAVRAAGSVLRAYVTRGRRAVLVTTGLGRGGSARPLPRRRFHGRTGRACRSRGRCGERRRHAGSEARRRLRRARVSSWSSPGTSTPSPSTPSWR